jgi:transaldolase
VTALETKEMIVQGRKLRQISDHIVVKLPTTPDGLSACKTLSSEGTPVNMTLVFSAAQALLTARAGASYCSPFLGRVDDIGWEGMNLIREIRLILDMHDLSTQIIAASVRSPLHVTEAAKAGAHIATMPTKVFQQLVKHPLTDIGLERFMADFRKSQGQA